MFPKFRIYFFLIFFTELLSFGVFLLPEFRQAIFFIIVFLVLLLSLQKLEYGLLILLAELFIGSKGYLFYFEQGGLVVSIRIALFLVIMSVWLAKLIIFWSKHNWRAAVNKVKFPFWQYYGLLAAAIIWGGVNGYWQGNEPSNIFFDANSWLYWLIILPLAFIVNEYQENINNFWREIAAIFSAATAWIITETLLLLFFFSHNFGAAAAQAIYQWIRITGVGEITFTPFGFYRIFIQSQIYVLTALAIAVALMIHFKSVRAKDKLLHCLPRRQSAVLWGYIAALLSFTAIIISFSRSFWLGAAIGLFCFYVFMFLCFHEKWRNILWSMGLTLSAAVLSVAVVFALVRFPFPQPIANFSPELLAQRALVAEAGVSSRWNLLPPLWDKIKQAPLLGKGFGATVTYQTQDPRVLEQNPSGIYTTYAFEWGYLDIWLKLGLLGLAVYLVLLIKIFYSEVKNFQFSIFQPKADPPRADNFQSLLNIALLSGLVTIMTTSFFSPYLNHPLGIGYVILLSFFIAENKKPQLLS